jgi:hypothetical protein
MDNRILRTIEEEDISALLVFDISKNGQVWFGVAEIPGDSGSRFVWWEENAPFSGVLNGSWFSSLGLIEGLIGKYITANRDDLLTHTKVLDAKKAWSEDFRVRLGHIVTEFDRNQEKKNPKKYNRYALSLYLEAADGVRDYLTEHPLSNLETAITAHFNDRLLDFIFKKIG